MATRARGSERQSVEIAPQAFVTLDVSGQVLYANPRAEELFGYESGAILGLGFAERLIAAADRELVDEALRSLTTGDKERQVSWRLDVKALARDGHVLPVEVTATGVPEHGDCVIH